MKMMVIQELAVQYDTKVLDLFEEHGPPDGIEQLYVSADGRQVIAVGDFNDMDGFNRSLELFQSAYAGPAQFIPLVTPEVAIVNSRAGIEARS